MVLALLLTAANALPSVNFTAEGFAHLSENVVAANCSISFEIPLDVGISGNQIEVIPVWNVSGAPYLYRKTLTISEPAGVARSNEKLVGVQLAFNPGAVRSDCRDIVLADANGVVINYQRTSCSGNQVLFSTAVPSISAGSSLTWYIYYSNPDDSTEKSMAVGGSFTTTHTNQNIGSCNSAGDHCSVAHISSSSCGGPSSYSPGYAIYVTRQSCSSPRSCGSGCSGSCGISNWEGDLGSTVNGGTSGTTSCSTAIMGGFSHSFSLDWSRLLTASTGSEERPSSWVQATQNQVPIFSHPNPGPFNLTLENLTSSSSHEITLNAGSGMFKLTSYITLNRTGETQLDREFVGNDALYIGRLDPGVQHSSLRFTTPSGAGNQISNLNFNFNSNSGSWTFADTGDSEVEFNFTLPAHNINLVSLKAPELEFVSSGVPESEYTRACYSGTCYLQYNFSSFRDVLALGVINQNDLLLGEWSVDEPALCSINNLSNETEAGTCRLQFQSNSSTITLLTENSTSWRAGQYTHTITPRTLNLTISAPGSGISGQPLSFSGWANDSITGEGVNGTVLAVLDGSSVQVNLTDGWFNDTITVPGAGSYKLRVVAMDPPGEEQIWGSDEIDFSVCSSNGNSCHSNAECCSGVCCSNICSSTCNTNSYSPSPNNRGSSGSSPGSSWTPPPQTPPTTAPPELSEFLSLLAQARRISNDPYLDQLSLRAQQALLNSDTETLKLIIQELGNWIQKNSVIPITTKEKINLDGINEPAKPELELSEPSTVEPPTPPPKEPGPNIPKPLNPFPMILVLLVLFAVSTLAFRHINYWA